MISDRRFILPEESNNKGPTDEDLARITRGLRALEEQFENKKMQTMDGEDDDDDPDDSTNFDSEESVAKSKYAYKPSKESPIYEYLESVKNRIQQGDFANEVKRGRAIFPPSKNPLSTPLHQEAPSASDFVVSNVHIFCWNPEVQFGHCHENVNKSHLKCVNDGCQEQGHLASE